MELCSCPPRTALADAATLIKLLNMPRFAVGNGGASPDRSRRGEARRPASRAGHNGVALGRGAPAVAPVQQVPHFQQQRQPLPAGVNWRRIRGWFQPRYKPPELMPGVTARASSARRTPTRPVGKPTSNLPCFIADCCCRREEINLHRMDDDEYRRQFSA